ncbi:hypothetical protein KM043_003268 [Ampulex compressa]|nr:hypothetical protein KM043_003268 [Ampulex compressa]
MRRFTSPTGKPACGALQDCCGPFLIGYSVRTRVRIWYAPCASIPEKDDARASLCISLHRVVVAEEGSEWSSRVWSRLAALQNGRRVDSSSSSSRDKACDIGGASEGPPSNMYVGTHKHVVRARKLKQLRVIRAFKSTLEDLEERRSVHSLHSLHSMRSSRSHTGPRPLSDFTYIDEDPTNTTQNAAKLSNKSADQNQDYETNFKGSRMQPHNTAASPLLLSVTGPANAYNHHYTINTTNDNRSSSNNALNQSQGPNHTVQTSSNRDTGNSLLLSSNNLVLPELTKLVHETSI